MIVSPASKMFEGDLVGCLLPLGPLDQRDHPVQEGVAGIRSDPHLDPV